MFAVNFAARLAYKTASTAAGSFDQDYLDAMVSAHTHDARVFAAQVRCDLDFSKANIEANRKEAADKVEEIRAETARVANENSDAAAAAVVKNLAGEFQLFLALGSGA
jgi:hypothetical protein